MALCSVRYEFGQGKRDLHVYFINVTHWMCSILRKPHAARTGSNCRHPFSVTYLDADKDGFVSECEFVDGVHNWLGGYDPAMKVPPREPMEGFKIDAGEDGYNQATQERLVAAFNALPDLTKAVFGQEAIAVSDLNAWGGMCGPCERINERDLQSMYRDLRLNLYKSNATELRSWADWWNGDAKDFHSRLAQASTRKGEEPCAYQSDDKPVAMLKNDVLKTYMKS